MLMDRDPTPAIPAEYDGFTLVERCVPSACRDLSLDKVRENGDVPEKLHTLVAGRARAHPKSELSSPRSPFLLVGLPAFEALWSRVEDERGLRVEELEVRVRIVGAEGSDNGLGSGDYFIGCGCARSCPRRTRGLGGLTRDRQGQRD
jgi:hypothetical protein